MNDESEFIVGCPCIHLVKTTKILSQDGLNSNSVLPNAGQTFGEDNI